MIYNLCMSIPLLDLLKDHQVFSSLSAVGLEQLAGAAISRSYPAGVFLTHAGDCWPYLFLVAEGRLSVLKESSEGRTLVIAELEPGELFWGLAFFQEGLPNPATVQIVEPSVLHIWSREGILPFLLENGRQTWELSQLLVNRMLHASQVIEGLAFQPVSGRLARLLLEDFRSAGEPAIGRHLTLDEMAARIGTTREMVCRALYRFADKKLIDVTRTEFVLTDEAGLGKLAEGSS
jgi:CRP-like cAMP-binding protein